MPVSETRLVDRYLPRFDFAERHAVTTAAPPDRVWRALGELDLSRSAVVRTLFRLRGLPRRALTLDGLEDLGFVRLGEVEGGELAYGLIGRFWTPGGGLRRLDPAAFESFAEPGYAKAVWDFRMTAAGSRTRLETAPQTAGTCA